MIQNQGLSYGLFHAIAQPVYSWGVIRKVTFPGVNMDIGHVRAIGWAPGFDSSKPRTARHSNEIKLLAA